MPNKKPFTVIAHRGAAGYLPEHTLEGAAMAHAMGVDYIELDVMPTRDAVLVVLHDLYLDAVSDVALRFPDRARKDGHFYAIDFLLEEIRSLRLHERMTPDGKPAFPARFPPSDALFRIPTLDESLALIQGLNHSRGMNVGIYIEPKAPAWHDGEGRDVVAQTLETLRRFDYHRREHKAILQSFDLEHLRRARFELKTDLKLVQLIGDNSWGESGTDFDRLQTEQGLQEVAQFADGIGPWLPQVAKVRDTGEPELTGLVARARRHGLFVHAYTFRADQLPTGLKSVKAAVGFMVEVAGLDGVFTDHPDLVLKFTRA